MSPFPVHGPHTSPFPVCCLLQEQRPGAEVARRGRAAGSGSGFGTWEWDVLGEYIYIYTDTHLLSPWDWYIYLLWARKGFEFVLMLRLKCLVKEEGAHVDPS